jgi:hypothetical protein
MLIWSLVFMCVFARILVVCAFWWKWIMDLWCTMFTEYIAMLDFSFWGFCSWSIFAWWWWYSVSWTFKLAQNLHELRLVYCCLDAHEHCCFIAMMFAMMLEFRLPWFWWRWTNALLLNPRVLKPRILSPDWSEYCSIGHQPMGTFHFPCLNASFE